MEEELKSGTEDMNSEQREAYMLFGAGMLAFGVTLPLAIYMAKLTEIGALRWFVFALPIVATGVIAWSVIQYVAALDEMQRRIQTEGLAYGFVLTLLLTVGVGVMENRMAMTIPWWIRFPFMVCAWQFGVLVARKKYL